YLRSMANRSMVGSGGLTMLGVDAGFPYKIAGQVTAVTIVVAAAYLLVVPEGAEGRRTAGGRLLARLPALGIILMTALDVVRRFKYLDEYILGLAPALLHLCDTP